MVSFTTNVLFSKSIFSIINFLPCLYLLLECPIISYNKGAPNINDYIKYLNSIGFIPFEPGEIHRIDHVFVQIDIFFLKKEILKKINNKRILKILN